MLCASVALLAVAVAAGSAKAASILINNGLAPPEPANVLDDTTYELDTIFVRNVGCNGLDNLPCASPGAPTAVSLVDGGSVNWFFIQDTSTFDMEGGLVGGQLNGRGFSTVTMNGGAVTSHLVVGDSSTLSLTGGIVGEQLRAEGDGLMLIFGSGFEVNGTPVPYGDLVAMSGVLTGMLSSGDLLSNEFKQGGLDGTYNGTIRLVPEPGTASLLGFGLLGLAAARRRAR